MAHSTAELVLGVGREHRSDPEVLERLVRLVQDEGLEVVAALWSASPATTLPGALWRLYLVGEWVRRDPRTIARRYAEGLTRAEVAGAVAGVEEPPGPQEVQAVVDRIMRGVFTGDVADQFQRVAAFLVVVATGSALEADWIARDDDALAFDVTRRAGALLHTARELEAAARLARAGTLD